MKSLKFSSPDNSYNVHLSSKSLSRILKYCRDSGTNETGGILIGLYNDDNSCADVLRVSGPGKGSKQSSHSFIRAVGQLQKLVDKLWGEKAGYYLGEWHFHPYSSPEPSQADCVQMQKIAKDTNAACPEIVLIILGGDPAREWLMSVRIFTRQGEMISLT